MIADFFDNSFNIIELLYLVFILTFIVYLYFLFLHRFLSEEKQLRYSSLARGHEFVMDKYDWTETLRRHRVSLLAAIILLFFVLVLTHIFGEKVADIGIWVVVAVWIPLAKWIGPVKKSNNK